MDQMSMAVSLEIREPFFDHDLIEFVINIPDKLKYPTYPKKLLVESVQSLLPNEIIHRKKQGFLFPWSIWMKKDLRSFCESKIRDICKRDFINEKELIAYWNRFLKNDPAIRWSELWSFIVLEHWMQKNSVQ
jgi:asparagine synthase (glutamine-hydrolysing)